MIALLWMQGPGSAVLAAVEPGPPLTLATVSLGVTLHRDISASNGTKIHIQKGEVKPFSKVSQVQPYCYFYFQRDEADRDQPLHLVAGTFPVIEIYNRREMVMAEPRKYAQWMMNGFGSDTQYTLATRMDLIPPPGSDLACLVCAIWADPREQYYLSLRDMQRTLGALATIGPR